jgi:hypothetical protein
MGRVVIHKLSNEALSEKRQQDFLKLSYAQRFQKAIELMRVSLLFSVTNNLANKNKVLIKH